MNTIIEKIDRDNIDINIVKKAADFIISGEVVIFPTETVYGIGANAFDANACKKIFVAKGRPSDNPLIVHVSDMNMLELCIKDKPTPIQLKIMKKFWPGALTIIMPKATNIPYEVTAGLDTVAVRMPSNSIALQLISMSKLPIAAPSANISGKPSSTDMKHILADMNGRVSMIIGSENSDIGLESTILDMTLDIPTILRPGGISIEDIREILPDVVLDHGLIDENKAPKAPGMKYKHYAPKAEMFLVEGDDVVNKINSFIEMQNDRNKKCGVLTTLENRKAYPNGTIVTMGERAKLDTVANNMFRAIRSFDDMDIDIIYSETFSEEGIGLAIMNRLKKAAGGKII